MARITIPADEKEKVRADIETIIAYVEQINEAQGLAQGLANGGEELAPEQQHNAGVKNVMRADENPHESGLYTDALIAAAPKSEKGYITVKKIL